jgi:hypothetical protein
VAQRGWKSEENQNVLLEVRWMKLAVVVVLFALGFFLSMIFLEVGTDVDVL